VSVIVSIDDVSGFFRNWVTVLQLQHRLLYILLFPHHLINSEQELGSSIIPPQDVLVMETGLTSEQSLLATCIQGENGEAEGVG